MPRPYRYAGAYVDPAALYKMGAPYYDSALGRSAQSHPSGQDRRCGGGHDGARLPYAC
ncbi:hypothetical protein [Streptomyces sp. NPDC006193]|uniref:hypothetical protein n=1 Tax=Streptomyces sp. NPDC006193 TaxID=3155717 RepID=UPI0033A14990